MPLVAPWLEPNLTEISVGIFCKNLTPGGTLRVYRDGVQVGSFAVSTVIEKFNFASPPFPALSAVTVRQVVGTELSPVSAQVIVSKAPGEPTAPNIDPRLVACCKYVQVTGIMPGFTVEVEGRVAPAPWTQRGVLASAVRSAELIQLNGPLLTGEELRVRVRDGIVASAWNVCRATPKLESPPRTPRFAGPLISCSSVVPVSNLIIGSRLDLYRNGVADAIGRPNAESTKVYISQPLVTGQEYAVRTVIDGCQEDASAFSVATVVALSSIPAPVILGKLCAGAVDIMVSGLVPTATVQIQQNGVVIGTGVASEETTVFRVAPLAANQPIRVRQGLCTPFVYSGFSNVVTTGSTSSALPTPTLDPVYDCGLSARVTNVEPGSRIEIRSDYQGTLGIVDVATNVTQAEPVDVALARKAIAGETLVAIATGCSQSPQTSAPVVVTAQVVRDMEFAPAEVGTYVVRVNGAVPGATVELYRNGVVAGTMIAPHGNELEFELAESDGPLATEDLLGVLQYLCTTATASSEVTTVTVPFQPWRVINTIDILAVHAAPFASGRVLLFGGSEHNHTPAATRTTNASRLYDPVSNATIDVGSPPFDLFCAGHCMMSDGRLLIAGGTTDYPIDNAIPPDGGGYRGAGGAAIYDDTQASPWLSLPNMIKKRWYPTLTSLADGRVLVAGGATGGGPDYDGTVWEVYQAGTWNVFPGPINNGQLYPRHIVGPGGILDNLHLTSGGVTSRPAIVNVNTGARTQLAAYPAPVPAYNDFNYGVLPLPVQAGQTTLDVLFIGGSLARTAYKVRMASGQALVEVFDPSGTTRRNDACAIYIADGRILLSGGGRQRALDDVADDILESRTLDPQTLNWTGGEFANVRRKYHSCTVLLKDGRVLSVGSQKAPPSGNGLPGAPCAVWEKNPSAPTCDANVYEVEDYRPSYFRAGLRPRVFFGPTVLARNTAFSIGTTFAWDVSHAFLVRLASFTHAGSTDFRCIRLSVLSKSGSVVRLAGTPTSASLAVPGMYFLYVVKHNGAVSVGWPVRLSV